MLLDIESAKQLFKELDTSQKGQIEIQRLISILEDILAGRFKITDTKNSNEEEKSDEDDDLFAEDSMEAGD